MGPPVRPTSIDPKNTPWQAEGRQSRRRRGPSIASSSVPQRRKQQFRVQKLGGLTQAHVFDADAQRTGNPGLRGLKPGHTFAPATGITRPAPVTK
jgi:hypothetical protein